MILMGPFQLRMFYGSMKTKRPLSNSAPEPLGEILENFLKPQEGLTAFPLNLLMLQVPGLQLTRSVVAGNDFVKGVFFCLLFQLAFFLFCWMYIWCPIKSPGLPCSPG